MKYNLELLKNKNSRQYPDVASFAFWCRLSNMKKHKAGFLSFFERVGRGLVIHITPSNVPVNFAFSAAFGLLSGNVNIVRLPTANLRQTEIITGAFLKILEWEEYETLGDRLVFVRYPKESNISESLSKLADARIIWGGDETISEIRSMVTKAKCVDILFPDRYSISIISASNILSISQQKLDNLAKKFTNDTFLFNQNGCSSPHLVTWIGDKNEAKAAQKKFWEKITNYAENLTQLAEISTIDKLVHALGVGITSEAGSNSLTQFNTVCRVEFDNTPAEIEKYRFNNGFFCELVSSDLEFLKKVVNERYQTVTYFGIEPKKIRDYVIDHGLLGIDRIVPIGTAFDLDIYWDGYDLVSQLTRGIEVK